MVSPPLSAPWGSPTSGTGTYYEGLLFEGWPVSRDGSVSAPLYDLFADQSGLPLGRLLVTPRPYSSRFWF